MRFLFVFFALVVPVIFAMEQKKQKKHTPFISTDIKVLENFGYRCPQLLKYDQLLELKKKNLREYNTFLNKAVSDQEFALFHSLRAEELASRTSDKALAEAALHCQKAKDYPPAQLQLARMYLEGKGVEKDKQHALTILEKAAAVRTMHLAGYKSMMSRPFYFCYLPALKQLAEIYRADNDSENFLRCLEWGMLIESNPEREQWSYQAGVLNFYQGNLTRAYKAFSLGKSSNDNQAGLLFLHAQQAWVDNNIDSTVNSLSKILELKNKKDDEFFGMARDWLYGIIQRSTNVELFDRVMPTLIASNDNVQRAHAVKLCDELLTTLKKCGDIKARDTQIKKYYNSETFKILQKMEKSDNQTVRETVLHHLGQVCHAVATLAATDESARKQAISYFEQLNADNLDAQLYLAVLHGLSKINSDLDKASDYCVAVTKNCDDVRCHFALNELNNLSKNSWKAKCHLLTHYGKQHPVKVVELLDTLPAEAFDDLSQTGAFDTLINCQEDKQISDAFVKYLKRAHAANFIKKECKKKTISYVELLVQKDESLKLFLLNLYLSYENKLEKALALLSDVSLQIENYDSNNDMSGINDILQCRYLLQENSKRDGRIALTLGNLYKNGIGRKKDDKGNEVEQIIGQDKSRYVDMLECASETRTASASYQAALYYFNTDKDLKKAIHYFKKTILQASEKDNVLIVKGSADHLVELAKLKECEGSFDLFNSLIKKDDTITHALYFARPLIDKFAREKNWKMLKRIESALSAHIEKNCQAEFEFGLLHFIRAQHNSDCIQSIQDCEIARTHMESAFNKGYNSVEKSFLHDCYLKLGVHALIIHEYAKAHALLNEAMDSGYLEPVYYFTRALFERSIAEDNEENAEKLMEGAMSFFKLLVHESGNAALFLARQSLIDKDFLSVCKMSKEEIVSCLEKGCDNKKNSWYVVLSCIDMINQLNGTLDKVKLVVAGDSITSEDPNYVEGRIRYCNGEYENAAKLFKRCDNDSKALAYLALSQLKSNHMVADTEFINMLARFVNRISIEDYFKREVDELLQAVTCECHCAQNHPFEIGILLTQLELKKYEQFKTKPMIRVIHDYLKTPLDYFFKSADPQEISSLQSFGPKKRLFDRFFEFSTNEPNYALLLANTYLRSALTQRCLIEEKTAEQNLKLAIKYGTQAFKGFEHPEDLEPCKKLLAKAYSELVQLYYGKTNQSSDKNNELIVGLLNKILEYDPYNKHATMLLVTCYLNDKTPLKGKKAVDSALTLWEQSANNNPAVAATFWPVALAGKVHTAQGVVEIPVDQQKAIMYLKMAVKGGDIESNLKYAKAIFDGTYGCKKDQTQALQMLEDLYQNSHDQRVLVQLGIFYFQMQQYTKAIECFSNKTLVDDPTCEQSLGFIYLAQCYKDGVGVSTDKTQVLDNIERALEIIKVADDESVWHDLMDLGLVNYLARLQTDSDAIVANRAKFLNGKLYYVQLANSCAEQSEYKIDRSIEIENAMTMVLYFLNPIAQDSQNIFFIPAHHFLADALIDWLCMKSGLVSPEKRFKTLSAIIEHLQSMVSDTYTYSDTVVSKIKLTLAKFFNIWGLFNQSDRLSKEQEQNINQLTKKMTITIRKSKLAGRINEVQPGVFLALETYVKK